MKFKIAGTKDDIPTMNIKLAPNSSGSAIYIDAVDAKGNTYNLAYISDKGIFRYEGIPADTGWPLTSKGALKLANVWPA